MSSQSLRIAIDNQIFLNQSRGGISRSFCALNNSLNKFENVESRIIAPIHINRHLFESKKFQSDNYYLPGKTRNNKLRKLIENQSDEYSRRVLRKYKPHIVHESFYRVDDPWSKSIPRITTVQDMIREKVDKNDKRAFEKKSSISRAQRIICISQNTKKDLMETWNINEDLIDVIYLGVDSIFLAKKIDFNKSDILLFVGNRGGYKNFNNFVIAFSRSKFLRENFRIVTFGGGAFNKAEIEMFTENNIKKSQVSNVNGDDKSLFRYYSKSAAFVYPSKYEGFGLPIVEAMAAGSLVFCSNSSAMPESGGNLAYYFNPDSIDSIIDTIETTLCNLVDLTQILFDSQVHAQKFDWNITARETLEVYRNVC